MVISTTSLAPGPSAKYQTAASNTGPWEDFEREERSLVDDGHHVFIVAGSLYNGETRTIGDGVVVVARMKIVRRQMLNELARQLRAMPTPVLGFVATAAGEEQGYGYGYGYGYYAKPYVQRRQAELEGSKA